jgi:5'-nucleotidase (lipoprotein e(P4) family)
MNKRNKTTKSVSRWGNFLVGILIGGGVVYGPLLVSTNLRSEGGAPPVVEDFVQIPVQPAISEESATKAPVAEIPVAEAPATQAPIAQATVSAPDADKQASTTKSASDKSDKEGGPAKENGAVKEVVLESPPYRGLDSNLYMQTSAEYRAICLQTYRWARRVIHDKIIARVGREGVDGAAPTKPPAVVLDLDETVLDNRQFQTRQIREGWAYNNDYWAEWEKGGSNDVGVVPGAVEFIHHLQTLGIQPIYITNRNVRAQDETLDALKRHEISVPTELLLCADANTKSNKDSRRALITDKYDVLMYVGDNLRDFDNMFKDDETLVDPAKRIEARKATVDEHREKFGEDWILLPNPAYGEWQKPLGKGIDDANQLEPRLP